MAEKLMPSTTRSASNMPPLGEAAPTRPPSARMTRPPTSSVRASRRPPSMPVSTEPPAPNAKKMEASHPAVTRSSPNSAEITGSAEGTLPTARPTMTPLVTASAIMSQRVFVITGEALLNFGSSMLQALSCPETLICNRLY